MDYHKERSFATNFFNFFNFFFQFKNLLQRVDLMYQRPKCPFVLFVSAGDFFFLIGIQSFQGWTTTTRHGVIRKRNTKRLRHTGNLFQKNRIKGCVLYILASLLSKSKREHLWSKGKCFLSHFKSSFRSWDNQILTFQILKHYDVIKCSSMKQQKHFTE